MKWGRERNIFEKGVVLTLGQMLTIILIKALLYFINILKFKMFIFEAILRDKTNFINTFIYSISYNSKPVLFKTKLNPENLNFQYSIIKLKYK